MATILFHSFDELRSALNNIAPQDQKITVILSVEKVIVQTFTVDVNLSDHDMMHFLQSRLETIMGHTANKLCLDYRTEKTSDPSKQIVIAIATHQELINTILSIFQKEKIPLHVITIDNENNLNLLPWRETKRKKNNVNRNKRFLLYAVIACIILFAINFLLIKKIDHCNNHILFLNKQNNAISVPNIAADSNFLKKLQVTTAEKLASVKINQTILSLLAAIANNVPNNIILDSLLLDQQNIKLTGSGDHLADMHQFNALLQQNSPWKHSQLSEIHNDTQEKKTMHFTLRIQP